MLSFRLEISRGWRENWLLSLEEVGSGCSGWYDALRVRDSTEQLGFSSVHVLEYHDRRDVSAAVAVVGRRPHGHQLFVKHELVAFMNKLMCTADELQTVDVHKLKQKMSMTFNQLVLQAFQFSID